MTDNQRDSHAVFSSDVIEFDPSMALLGIDTNGAAPQRIYGFHVSGDIDEYDGEAIQSYWLRVMTDKSKDTMKGEYVMFADSANRIETVLAAIISASVNPNFDKPLDGEFDGYANSAQIAFDGETTEECIEDLKCRVSALHGGFSFKLLAGDRAIASIAAKMTPKGIDKTIALVERLRSWSSEHVDAIESRIKSRVSKI